MKTRPLSLGIIDGREASSIQLVIDQLLSNHLNASLEELAEGCPFQHSVL